MRVARLAVAMMAGAAIWMSAAPTFAAPVAKPTKQASDKDIVLVGDARCTECHDENDSPEALAIGKTRHGTNADARTPTCSSCHGESDLHVKEAGRGSGPTPTTDVGFSNKHPATAEARNAACLSCHQGGTRIFWQNSTHSRRDVTCASCHKVHDGHDKVRDIATQPEVCANCHKEQRAQFARPNHHPVPEGAMGCSSCHNVHGDNPAQLAKPSVNETCYSCHMEKRGPFVHSHQPVTEDCSICHNPHGTNVAGLLKARTPYLCQECHAWTRHPGSVADLPNSLTGRNGTVGRGCLNCHTNIHGGNSLEDSTAAVRFLR